MKPQRSRPMSLLSRWAGSLPFLGAALVALLLCARSRRRRHLAPVSPSVDAIASAVVRRLHAPERSIYRRKIALLGIVLLTCGLIALAVVSIRPAVHATLRLSGQPAMRSFEMTGDQTGSSLNGAAQLRTLAIAESPSPNGDLNQLELILPIDRSKCTSLAHALGGQCDRERAPRTLAHAPIAITSSDTAEAIIKADHVGDFALSGDAIRNASLQIDTRRLVIRLECRSPFSRFSIDTGASREVEQDCRTASAVSSHVILRFASRPSVSLLRLGGLDLSMSATTSAVLQTQQATMSVDGHTEIVQRRDPARIVARVARSDREAASLTSGNASSPSVMIDLAHASSLRVGGGTEMVPTMFSKYSALVYALAGVLAGVVTTLTIELMGRRHKDLRI